MNAWVKDDTIAAEDINSLLDENYHIQREIGHGGFGTVYLGHDKRTYKKVAIKVERLYDCDDEFEDSYLAKEYDVYLKLKGKNSIGITDVKLYGCDGFEDGCVTDRVGSRCYMIMDLLGPDLEKLLYKCTGKFSLKTVLLLADQMISIIQYIHSKYYIHGDVKPGNFLLGRRNKDKMLYMVDFGLAKQYRDSLTLEHIAYSETGSYRGTTRFTSLNCHRGIEQSRRDDLESLGYVFLYLLRGDLPWQDSKAKYKEKRKLVYEKKMAVSIEELCSGYPSEFVTYLTYCRSLTFDQNPDYPYFRKLFKDLFHRSGYTDKREFDWNLTQEEKSAQKFHNAKVITSSEVLPEEMLEFFHTKYSISKANEDLSKATVEQLVGEAFRFMFPDVPQECSQYSSNNSPTWNEIAPKLCAKLFTFKDKLWLKENFTLDYSESLLSDSPQVVEQGNLLLKGADQHVDDSMLRPALLALQIHRLLVNILEDEDCTESGDVNSEGRGQQVKDVILKMMSFVDIPCLYTGAACRLDFDYLWIPDRSTSVTLEVRPDTTMCVPFLDNDLCGYVKYDEVFTDLYPICLLQVLRPPDDTQEIEGSESSAIDTTVYSDSDGTISYVLTTSLNPDNIALPDTTNPANVAMLNKSNCENIRVHKKTFKKDKPSHNNDNVESLNTVKDQRYTANNEINIWPNWAVKSVTVQFALELYGLLIKQHSLKSTKTEYCESLGLFVINEYVYMAKLKHKTGYIQLITQRKDFKESFNKHIDGPEIVYTNWGFNLKKPNDRLALLVFCYHYRSIIFKRLHKTTQ